MSIYRSVGAGAKNDRTCPDSLTVSVCLSQRRAQMPKGPCSYMVFTWALKGFLCPHIDVDVAVW